MNLLPQEAHDYAAHGLAVFPLKAREKKPYGFSTGLKAASTDVELVTAWWAGRTSLPIRAPKEPGERLPSEIRPSPLSNIGMATGPASGCWVLDVDGPAGIASLLELARRFGGLPPTVRQNTGKGGHLFYAWPASGLDLRNSASKFAEGLDIRGDGGYVVLPPSIHPSGRPYQWVDGCSPFDRPFAQAPLWLLRIICPPAPPPRPGSGKPVQAPRQEGASRYAQGALDSACREIAGAMPGTRNTVLHRQAFGVGSLVAGGLLDRSAARAAVVSAASAMRDPFPAADIERFVDHAFKRAEAYPRSAPPEGRR